MKSLLLEEKVGFAKQNSDEVEEINFYNNSLIITPHQSCGRSFLFLYILFSSNGTSGMPYPTSVDETLSQNKVTVIIVFFYYSFVLSQRNQKTFKGKPLENPRSIMPEN